MPTIHLNNPSALAGTFCVPGAESGHSILVLQKWVRVNKYFCCNFVSRFHSGTKRAQEVQPILKPGPLCQCAFKKWEGGHGLVSVILVDTYVTSLGRWASSRDSRSMPMVERQWWFSSTDTFCGGTTPANARVRMVSTVHIWICQTTWHPELAGQAATWA